MPVNVLVIFSHFICSSIHDTQSLASPGPRRLTSNSTLPPDSHPASAPGMFRSKFVIMDEDCTLFSEDQGWL